MQITTFLAASGIFIASAAAQSATGTITSSAPASTSTGGGDLNSLISQFPQCAIDCLDSSSSSTGCSASDLTCLCANSDTLVSSIGLCVLGCTPQEQSQIQSLAGSLCGDVNSANSAELASASNYITSALGTAATASGTSSGSSPTSASGNAAARTDSPLAGMGAMGAAAALAVLAL